MMNINRRHGHEQETDGS